MEDRERRRKRAAAVIKCGRNWRMESGVRRRTRGWQLEIGSLYVRYGVYYPFTSDADLRLAIDWRPRENRHVSQTAALLYVVFPRAKVWRD